MKIDQATAAVEEYLADHSAKLFQGNDVATPDNSGGLPVASVTIDQVVEISNVDLDESPRPTGEPWISGTAVIEFSYDAPGMTPDEISLAEYPRTLTTQIQFRVHCENGSVVDPIDLELIE